MTKRSSSSRNILTVMGGTLSSRVLGLLRQGLFNAFDTTTTDAFNVAFRVPNFLRELLAEGGLSNSIIPVYASLEPAQRQGFVRGFLAFLIAVNAVLVGLGIVFAPAIVALLAGPNPKIDVALTVWLTRLMMPFLAGISLSALAMGLLNAEERFGATSFAPVAFNLVTVGGMLVFPGNATLLGVMTSLGGFAQLLVQLPALHKAGLLPAPRLLWPAGMGRALGLMAPFAFTTSVRQFLNVVLTRYLAAFPQGAVTGFYNAENVFQLCLGLFAVSPATAAYTRLANFAASRNWAEFRETVSGFSRIVLFFSVIASGLLLVLPGPITSALFEFRGRISDDKYNFTTLALPAFALAITPWGLNALLIRALYALEKTREAVVMNAVAFALNTALYAYLARFGFAAMNYATAATGWLMVGAYVFFLKREVGLDWQKIVRHGFKLVFAAGIASVAAWLLARVLPHQHGFVVALVNLFLAGGAGLVVYVAACALLRVPELEAVRRRLPQRFFRR